MDHFDLLALSGNNETLAKFAAFVVVQALVFVMIFVCDAKLQIFQ